MPTDDERQAELDRLQKLKDEAEAAEQAAIAASNAAAAKGVRK